MGYCVITADVNESKRLPERKELQQRILQSIAEVNVLFKEHLAAEFMITLGDEWQGVLKSLGPSYRVASYFLEKLYPIAVAFGIGEGTIATELSPRPTEMDGEVFHRSRNALNQAKRSGQIIVISTSNPQNDLLLNTTLRLLQTVRETWTKRQFEKVMLYKQHRKEEVVASILEVSQADINQALSSTRGRVYLDCEDTLNEFLNAIDL